MGIRGLYGLSLRHFTYVTVQVLHAVEFERFLKVSSRFFAVGRFIRKASFCCANFVRLISCSETGQFFAVGACR